MSHNMFAKVAYYKKKNEETGFQLVCNVYLRAKDPYHKDINKIALVKHMKRVVDSKKEIYCVIKEMLVRFNIDDLTSKIYRR